MHATMHANHKSMYTVLTILIGILSVVFLTLGSLSLLAVLIMDCLYHKWLGTHNKTGNPIKLIFQVLNYTRKNKYPRLRSALTYID